MTASAHSSGTSIDFVAWVRRVNSRWIVHGELNTMASAYLDHLEQGHPDRLIRSCEVAHRLVHSLEPAEDPKPWFYGGLFSQATAAEAERFLSAHPFLLAIVPSVASVPNLPGGLAGAGPDTIQKIGRLRDALAEFARPSS